MFLFPVVFGFQGTGTVLFSWSEHSLPYREGQTKLGLKSRCNFLKKQKL